MAGRLRQIKTFLGAPRLSQIFPPPDGYQYFQEAGRFPFETQAQGHSRVNAWWLAEFSLLVYEELKNIHNLMNLKDIIAVVPFESPESSGGLLTNHNTQGFLAETPRDAFIVFRGTEFPHPAQLVRSWGKLAAVYRDLVTDIQVQPATSTDNPAFDVPIHTGFSAALQSVWEPLQAALLNIGNKPLWLAGHSLGGALATLLAYQLGEARVAGVYTFGAPCAGTAEFARDYLARGLCDKTFRYVHGIDAVPELLKRLPLANYEHVGTLTPLDAGKRRGSIGQWINRLLGRSVGLDQLDHMPIYYAYETWNSIVD